MNHQIYVAKKDGTPKFLIVENEVYTLEPLTAALEQPPVVASEPAPRRQYGYATKAQKSETAPRKKETKVRSCSLCGKPGHRSDKCPLNSDEPYGDRRFKAQRDEGSDTDEETEKDDEATNTANPKNPPKMDDAELEAKIAELRDQGLDSLRIAARLHIRLADVNKHWKSRPTTDE